MLQQMDIDCFSSMEKQSGMSTSELNRSLHTAIWRKDGDYLVACDAEGNQLSDGGKAIRKKELRVDLTERELSRALKRYPELAGVAHGVGGGRMAVTVYVTDHVVQRAGCRDGMADAQIVDALRRHISGGRR